MFWHPKVWLNDCIWCGFNENHKSSTFCILGCRGRCQWFKSRTTQRKSSQIRMARRRFRKWLSSNFHFTNQSISRNLICNFPDEMFAKHLGSHVVSEVDLGCRSRRSDSRIVMYFTMQCRNYNYGNFHVGCINQRTNQGRRYLFHMIITDRF